MIFDFISNLRCVRQDEIYDYQVILSTLKQKKTTVFSSCRLLAGMEGLSI